MGFNVNRRDLLESLGLGAAAYWLPRPRAARAAEAGIPKRFVVFYSQHGTLPWLWATGAGGTGEPTANSWDLGPLLEPLRPFKDRLLLLGTVDMRALDNNGRTGNCGHASGQAGSLTAAKQLNGKRANGPSIDHAIAEGLKAKNGGTPPTKFSAFHWALHEKRPNLALWGQPFHSGPGQLINIAYTPLTEFQRIFPGGMAPMAMTDPNIQARKKSVLDFATQEFTELGKRMGAPERARLDQHASLIRDLEMRLAVSAGNRCKVADAAAFDQKGRSQWSYTSEAFPLLMQAVFACDLARVVCLQIEEPAPASYGYTPGSLGTSDLHDLVHKLDVDMKEKNDRARLEMAKKYYLENAKTFAKVLTKLDEIKEPDGKSMLDHSAVLWAGEIGEPGHWYSNNKWLVAGSAGGYFKTGRFLPFGKYDRGTWSVPAPEVPSNGDLFVSLANAMGLDMRTFGEPSATRGPIAAMRG